MARGPYKPREPGSIKDAVNNLFAQIGRKIVGAKLGLSSTQVAALTDEGSPEKLSLERAVMLSGPDAPAIAEFFALLCRGVYLPLSPDSADLSHLAASDVRAHCEVTAGILAALQDGHMDAKEAAQALVKVRASLRVLVGLYAAIESIIKSEGGENGRDRND
jgi:hypothetical protein